MKIIHIFGREILKSGSWRKTLSKRHRPKTGRAAAWELKSFFGNKNFFHVDLILPGIRILTLTLLGFENLYDATLIIKNLVLSRFFTNIVYHENLIEEYHESLPTAWGLSAGVSESWRSFDCFYLGV